MLDEEDYKYLESSCKGQDAKYYMDGKRVARILRRRGWDGYTEYLPEDPLRPDQGSLKPNTIMAKVGDFKMPREISTFSGE